MMSQNPMQFRVEVQETLRRHATAVNTLVANGAYSGIMGTRYLKHPELAQM